jgi:uncharacterized protein
VGALLAAPDRYEARTPWGPFSALAIAVMAAGAQIAIVAGVLAASATIGLGPAEVDDLARRMVSLATPEGLVLMAVGQLAALGIIWVAAGVGGTRAEVLRLGEPKPAWGTAVLAGGLVALAVGMFELLVFLATGADFRDDARWLIEGLKQPTWWLVVIIAVVLAPLWEEVCFRGFLLSALAKTRLGFWPAALLINVLWTGLHWGYSYAGLASVLVAGMALSWLMRRTGSMRAVVVAHAVANAVAVLFAVIVGLRESG